MPGWYWLEGHTEFNEVVRIAMRKILQGSLPNELEPEEIRDRVKKYYELTKVIYWIFVKMWTLGDFEVGLNLGYRLFPNLDRL